MDTDIYLQREELKTVNRKTEQREGAEPLAEFYNAFMLCKTDNLMQNNVTMKTYLAFTLIRFYF